jgi:hypothetical protein
MTREHIKLSQLDVGLNKAQLKYSFFCYYKQNLADVTDQNTGLENLKTQFGTRFAPSAPFPREWGGGRKRIIRESNVCSCISFMVWFELTSSTVPLTAIQNLVPYYKR